MLQLDESADMPGLAVVLVSVRYSSIILICIRHTVSHSTTVFTMSDGLLHWIQLHVSALGMDHHQVVLRLTE